MSYPLPGYFPPGYMPPPPVLRRTGILRLSISFICAMAKSLFILALATTLWFSEARNSELRNGSLAAGQVFHLLDMQSLVVSAVQKANDTVVITHRALDSCSLCLPLRLCPQRRES